MSNQNQNQNQNKNKKDDKKKKDIPKASTELTGGISSDFCILRPNNFYRFKKELTIHAGKVFPDLARLLEKDEYWEPEEVSLPPDEALTESKDPHGF
jgi:hypothetical protein